MKRISLLTKSQYVVVINRFRFFDTQMKTVGLHMSIKHKNNTVTINADVKRAFIFQQTPTY